MDISIRKLTPDLAEDYVRFFDVTPYNEYYAGNDEIPCYCIKWRNDDSYDSDNTHWYPTREERREKALQFVRDGKIQGYLAYRGDEAVGWCSATADNQGGVDYMRSYYPIEKYRADIKVKSIFCFMVAPEVQRAGVATQMVERICRDAAAEGFDFVEAYVNKKYTELDCRGPLAMYEKCGFSRSAEGRGKKRGTVVVRKALK